MPSSISDALLEIQSFLNRDTSTPWKLDKATVANRLNELVNNPQLISQGNLNLCGPASTFYLWSKRDPLAFSQYCIQLFEQGEAKIGDIIVKPDSDLINQVYSDVLVRMGTTPCPQAEWMAMSALRDSANGLLDYEGTPEEDASGITTPPEIREWLVATGFYTSVVDEGNYLFTKEVEHAKNLQPQLNQDIIMLINATMIESFQDGMFAIIANRFPNHYIVLNEPINFRENTVSINYWSWGDNHSNEIDLETFTDNYYGAIIANF